MASHPSLVNCGHAGGAGESRPRPHHEVFEVDHDRWAWCQDTSRASSASSSTRGCTNGAGVILAERCARRSDAAQYKPLAGDPAEVPSVSRPGQGRSRKSLRPGSKTRTGRADGSAAGHASKRHMSGARRRQASSDVAAMVIVFALLAALSNAVNEDNPPLGCGPKSPRGQPPDALRRG